MKRLVLTSVLMCLMMALSGLSCMAQEPVKWTAAIQMTNDSIGVLTLKGEIAAGWHVYGLKLPDVGPQPTKLTYKGRGIQFVGNAKMSPSPIQEMDPMFEAELQYWEKSVTFTRKFKVLNPSVAEVGVTVSYMCCNDASCRPPKTEEFTIKVNEKK